MSARKEGRQVDPKVVLPEAINGGFDSLLKEKKAKGEPKPSFADEMREFFNNKR